VKADVGRFLRQRMFSFPSSIAPQSAIQAPLWVPGNAFVSPAAEGAAAGGGGGGGGGAAGGGGGGAGGGGGGAGGGAAGGGGGGDGSLLPPAPLFEI